VLAPPDRRAQALADRDCRTDDREREAERGPGRFDAAAAGVTRLFGWTC